MVILWGWLFLMNEVPLYLYEPVRTSPHGLAVFFFSSLLLSSLELSDTQVYEP